VDIQLDTADKFARFGVRRDKRRFAMGFYPEKGSSIEELPDRKRWRRLRQLSYVFGRNPTLGVVVFLVLGVAFQAAGDVVSFDAFFASQNEDAEVFVVAERPTISPAAVSVVLAVGGPVQPQDEDWTNVVLPLDGVLDAYPSPSPVDAGRRSSRAASEYVVKTGDTLSEVASQYGVSMSSVVWANSHLKNFDFLRPGDVLRIPPADGVLYQVKQGETLAALAKKFNADSEKVIQFNGLPADGTLAMGDEIFFVGGEVPPPPAPPAAARPRVVGGALSASAPPSNGYYGLPTSPGYRRSRGITSYHFGVDMANNCGTPIFASADGVVTRAEYGWNGGFGNVIVISHPNGTETLYAHLLQIYVTKGQQVGKGNVIAQMGGSRSLQGAQAGRSTGCHVHFEVHGDRNPF